VVALLRGQTVGNFLMAFKALECRRAGSELVAGVALRGAVEGLVRFRERSGRNLSVGTGCAEDESAQNQEKAEEATHGHRDSADTTARYYCNEKRHQLPPANRS